MAERVKKLKEEPLLDESLPHPYRELRTELRAVRSLLEEIRDKLPVAVPPVVVRPGVLPIKIPAIQLPKEDFMKIYVEAFEKYGALKFADDLHVETLDLGTARTTDELTKFVPAVALTIFSNTGSIDLYLNEKDDYHKLTFAALTYPQTFLLDWFRLKKLYITNTAQSGKTAVLIAWKRLS